MICDKMIKIGYICREENKMKLLATDYDGTLKYAQKVMEEDIEAIQKWKQEGNLFVIVTGRSLESISMEIEKYNLPCDFIVSNNGGMVFDAKEKELMSNYLDYSTCLDIIQEIKKMEHVASYVVNDGIHRHKVVVNAEETEQRYPTLQPDMSEAEVLDSGKFAQIVVSMATLDSALHVAEQINQNFSTNVVAYANNFAVDVVPKGISKATGLDFVVEYAAADETEVYSIGDAHNDIPMIEYGIHGCAMEMAADDVKQFATNVYASVHDLICDVLD